MRDLEWFIEELRKHFPGLKITTEGTPASTFVDVTKFDATTLSIEFREGKGFGFFISEIEGFGENPDSILSEKEKALELAITLIEPKAI